ncbi:AMP-dependent synthetase [Herbaspirillum hiltneri N3]|uniref:AMP-dependent synthetase n=1 Tax=Herbaspirillum hiltneri N3 TaxID=1262470 RepID=A0ABN4HQS8_9BURK|nr:AMP-binding protein [Herbaspirillum hiltneri]AKZ61298.1 AMP-dependent synthetase [Herbaspirillum hiltneri N3]
MHRYTHYFPSRCGDDRLDVVSLLLKGLLESSDRTLIVFNGRKTSFAEMAVRVAAMQKRLAAHGIRRGDRVALMLENGLDHMALIYALMLSGVVWVPVNTRLKAPGISYLLGHCTPTLFIAQRSFAEPLAELPELQERLAWLDEFAGDIPADEQAPARPFAADIAPLETLCLIYTSGTTGAPKGVVFTHRMMRIASEGTLTVSDVRPGDRMFVWEPLCHIGGAQMLLVPFLQQTELHIVERFSSSKFWQQIEAAQATHLHYLGGILDILTQLPPAAQPPHHTLRVAWGAGVSPRAWNGILERLKLSLRECYGMTEGSSFTTVNTSGKVGSIGRALPWLKVELRNADGTPTRVGEIGQVVVSSDVEGCFLPGYLDNPKASAEALQGGKLHTGDMARMDEEGDLYFVGRKTDSMRVRGENVSAWEIERVFVMHPAVAAAAAVGVTGDIGEQEIMLYVQYKEGAEASFPALAEWAKSKLASFQLPRYYVQADGFETTLSERIKKHLLKPDLAAAWDSSPVRAERR